MTWRDASHENCGYQQEIDTDFDPLMWRHRSWMLGGAGSNPGGYVPPNMAPNEGAPWIDGPAPMLVVCPCTQGYTRSIKP